MDIHTTKSLNNLQKILPELASEAKARAGEFEEARQISQDYIDKLKSIGAYRILVSSEQNGLGGSLIDWSNMITILSEADASTGWTVAHGAMTSCLIANIATPKFVDIFFANSNASVAWSSLPRVTVQEVKDGLVVNGRWAFGTGCTSATFVGGMIPLPYAKKNYKQFVVAFAPIQEATIDYTWDPIGMAGTGSHDIVVENVFVPWSHIFNWPDCKPRNKYPSAITAPGAWFVSICAAATHLGLARRAIDEARIELEGHLDRITKLPVLAKTEILRTLEQAEGLHYACSAGFEKALNEVWECGLSSMPLSVEQRLRMRLAAVTAVHQCETIVRSVYDIAGAGAMRRSGVLQRLFRDASCLTHHVSANLDSFNKIGRVRNGIDSLTYTI